jgi:hypothetical protein
LLLLAFSVWADMADRDSRNLVELDSRIHLPHSCPTFNLSTSEGIVIKFFAVASSIAKSKVESSIGFLVNQLCVSADTEKVKKSDNDL